jgi:hypothetical protein
VGPDADAGEEVGLLMVSDVLCLQVSDAALVDRARRDVTSVN